MKVSINIGKCVLVFLVLLMMPMLAYAYNLSDSLTAYYEFENNYNDLTGYGNDGSLYGNVSFVTGFNGTQGIHIDDAYSYIDLGNSSNFQIVNDITITAWLYLGSTPAWNSDYYFFISKGYDGEFDLYYTPYAVPSPQIRMVKTGTTGLVTDTLATDGWVFFAFTTSIPSDNFTSFQNGTMTATESGVQGVVSQTLTPVLLGNRGDDASDDSIYGSNMTMDNVGIWSRALSEEEISALFNGSSPLEELPTPNTAPSISLSVYWDLYNNMICNATATDDYNSTIAVDTCWKTYTDSNCLPSGNTTYNLSNGTTTQIGNFSQPFTYSTKKRCVAVAYDGELESAVTNSATLGEWQPHLRTVTASQNTSGDNNLECYGKSYGGFGTSIVYESRWYNESIYQAGYENSLNVTDTNTYLVGIVPYANLTNGDNWTCEVRTYNGEHYAPYINSSVVTAVVTTTTTTIVPTPTGAIVERNINVVITLLVVFMIGGIMLLIKQIFMQ